MAEERQPESLHEGADAPDVLPASKEDRKAAAALSGLDANPSEDVKPKKEADLKALNEAMKNLDMTTAKPNTAVATVVRKEEAPKKLVKVDAADVAMLVDQLDLSKSKATELLRAHDADALQAITAWVTASS